MAAITRGSPKPRLTLPSCDEKSRYALPSASQSVQPCAATISGAWTSDCVAHGWSTYRRSRSRISAADSGLRRECHDSLRWLSDHRSPQRRGGTWTSTRREPIDLGLAALLGPAVEPDRLADDLAAQDEILRLVARLWEAPIDPLAPVPPFTPDWDEAR